jgi:hypothetical protein
MSDPSLPAMTKEELVEALTELGVPDSFYYLKGGLPPDRHTLEERQGTWAVYYAEKGNRNSEAVFTTEDEACRELLRRVISDNAVRREDVGIPRRGGHALSHRPTGVCPRDGAPALQSPRYPHALCRPCVDQATDAAGRPVSMSNVSVSGGFRAVHTDDGTTCEQVLSSGRVLSDSVEYRAGEARMGGIVVEPIGPTLA